MKSAQKIILITVLSVQFIIVLLVLFYFTGIMNRSLNEKYNLEFENYANTVALGVKLAFLSENFEAIKLSLDFMKEDNRLQFVSIVQVDSIWNDNSTDYTIEKTVVATYPDDSIVDPYADSNDNSIIKRSPFISQMMNGEILMSFSPDVLYKSRNRNRITNAIISLLIIISALFIGLWQVSINRKLNQREQALTKAKVLSDNLLLNILPTEIAEELKEKGSADAKNFEMVSVLFTDFKEFTKKSAKLSAKELIAEINHCFKAFDLICEKYGIEKIKTIGDAYMAAGGLPVPSDNAVKNTVLAALDMQVFITNRIVTKRAKNEDPFEMRLGIHSGPVVAGIVGVKKFQYDIWGDTVNTASRMESSGGVGRVNISMDTYNLIKDEPQFTFEARGKIHVKGKGKLEMYFVYSSII